MNIHEGKVYILVILLMATVNDLENSSKCFRDDRKIINPIST